MNMICRCGPRTSAVFTRVHATDAGLGRNHPATDPTGTLPLQREFIREMRRRWAVLSKAVPALIKSRMDPPALYGTMAMTGDDPVRTFQSWFDAALQLNVVGNGAWMLNYVRRAGDLALARAEVKPPEDRIPVLQTLAHTELQGIAESVSQAAVREYALGTMSGKSPVVIARAIQQVIDKGRDRTDQLVAFIIVRAFSVATLDAYRAAGVPLVGVIAERVPAASLLARDAKPSAKSKASKPKPKNLVEVLTAGDNKVCPKCEQISEEGPYTLKEAENLIPAHPRCRCAFVPWDDARFASVRDGSPDQPRDKHGRWTITNEVGEHYDVSVTKTDSHWFYHAHSKGKQAAEAAMASPEARGDKVPYVGQIVVEKPHRGKGLANALYTAIEKHQGIKLTQAPEWRTKSGEALWKKRRKLKDAFNPEQPRDKTGKWSGGSALNWFKKFSEPQHKPAQIPGPTLAEIQARDYESWKGLPGLKTWLPPSDNNWRDVPGQSTINEPPLPALKPGGSVTLPDGRVIKYEGQRLSSGVIVREPDGRTWLVKPKNGYGGYKYTWPKGGVEDGLSPQANAIKEAYEESGLKVRITGHAGDYQGDTSVTRMYHAVREDGHPKDHHWETESVALVHPSEVKKYLNRSRDLKIAKHHLGDEQWKEEDHPRDKSGKFAVKAGTDTKFEAKIEKFKKELLPGNGPSDLLAHYHGNYGPPDVHGLHVLEVDNEHEIAVMNAAAKHGIALHEHTHHSGSTFKVFSASHAAVEPEMPRVPFVHSEPPLPDHAMLHMEGMTKIAGKKGSNEGGVYQENSTGNKYYIKTPKTLDHVQNELMAAKLYQLAGVRTMDYVPVKGGAHVATVLQPLEKDNIAKFNADERHEAQKDFGVHAWLANWDAAGTGGDNQVIVNGKVHTVDVGGSLKYRAQGDPKGIVFGDKVIETTSMLNHNTAPDAAALYGNMTDAQKIASYKVVTNLHNDDIMKTVAKSDMSPQDKYDLVTKLIARKQDLLAQQHQLEAKVAAPLLKQTIKIEEPSAFDPEPAPTDDISKHKIANPTKPIHVIHNMLLEGATQKELTAAVGWKSMNVPEKASVAGLSLTVTKKNGVNFYKGTPIATGTKVEIKPALSEAAVMEANALKAVEPKANTKTEPISSYVEANTLAKALKKNEKLPSVTFHSAEGKDAPYNNTHSYSVSSEPEFKELKEKLASYGYDTSDTYQGKEGNGKPFYGVKIPANYKVIPNKENPYSVPEPAVPKYDISTPLGNFQQSLAAGGINFSTQESAVGHFITLSDPKDVSLGIQTAKWHPKVEKLSAHEYFVPSPDAAKKVTEIAAQEKENAAKAKAITSTPPTEAELQKAKKNTKLTAQYVPGAPQGHPEAEKLIAAFNAKYEGKDDHLKTHEALVEKVNDFKKLTAAMVPFMSEQQKQAAAQAAEAAKSAAEKQAKLKAAQEAKVAAEKAAEAALEADPVYKAHKEALKNMFGETNHYAVEAKNIIKENPAFKNHTVPEATAIILYRGNAYKQVNAALRKGEKMTLEQIKYAQTLNDALQKLPVHVGYVQRGIDDPGGHIFDDYAKSLDGVTTDLQFNSGGKKVKLWGDLTLHINSIRGRDMSSINGEGGGEIVFRKGSHFHVKKVNKATKEIWMDEV